VNPVFCKVALDTPLRRCFDYLPPRDAAAPVPGARVLVPFGRQQLVGVVTALADSSDLPVEKLRQVLRVLDATPLLSAADLALLEWAAAYYHHPIGSVFATALPKLLRDGRDPGSPQVFWSITAAGRVWLQDPKSLRAKRQHELLQWLAARDACDEEDLAELLPGWREPARALLAKGFVATTSRQRDVSAPVISAATAGPRLDPDQANAVTAVTNALGQFAAFLLDGVTGSGKTEVYLQLVETVLARGESVLVLCPEIGLAPQLVERFAKRFATPIAALHSGMTDRERLGVWHDAAVGRARILIGTRSAVFTPLPRLGLVIVDEEHDASYKQQEGGFRYSARDLALLRAQQVGVPIVLGSATPSFESLHNVATAKFMPLLLTRRAGNAQPPRLSLVDLRAHAVHKGLSIPLLQAMDRHLAAGAQVLLFINRRGYAPTLICNTCGWIAPCHACDARMTVHQKSQRLSCHHCGAEEKLPERCARCGYEVRPLGHGTERVEETLVERFPGFAIERFDRDKLRQQSQLEGAIDRVHSGEARILVGTQMLTKGHHFPEVALVGVLNADQSLFSTDFRAAERLAQTIVQVAGRAGRADRVGDVLIQTQYPEHPLLQSLLNEGYGGFAAQALVERNTAHWPPYSRLALLRASGVQPDAAIQFLQQAKLLMENPDGVTLQGPIPAAMVRKAGRYYAQLLVESAQRLRLQKYLAEWIEKVEQLPSARKVRWALDVDPLDVF
jgi:primosomal protein N' (replication factor Y) (superfamily II helicase)